MNMGGIGYSLGGTLGILLYIIIKLLIIVLAVVVVLGVFGWVRDNFLRNKDSKLFKDINKDPVLKAVSVITLAIVGLTLLFALLHSILAPGMNANLGMSRVHGGFYMGYNPSYGIEGVLIILIRVFMYILVISLLLAAIMYLKNLYESGKLNNIFSNMTNQNQTCNSNTTKTEETSRDTSEL